MSEAFKLKPQVSKRAMIVSFIMIMVVGIISNYIYCLAVYVGPLHEQHNWSLNTIVLAYSVAMFCEIPTYIIGGQLSNKFGMKKVLVICGVLYGLAILGSGLVTSVTLFVVFQGIIGSLAMYGIYVCTLAIINAMYPDRKGFVIGLLYGLQAAGGAFMAPLANMFIDKFDASTALVWQGAIFTIIMFVCCMLVTDPTKGDKRLMAEIQVKADKEELAEALAGKSEDALPTMRWKKALCHPGLWLLFVSVILIQMFGNVLCTDISVIAKNAYGVSAADAAWVITAFAIGCGVGSIVVGIISDKMGPYRTTFWLGIIDGVLLFALAIVGVNSFMMFAVLCVIQGFTYNGMTALNPIMVTDAYIAKDMGIMLGVIGVSYAIVGTVGPQLGLSVSFVPIIIICGVCSIVGGFFAKLACSSMNKYYRSENSNCVVR